MPRSLHSRKFFLAALTNGDRGLHSVPLRAPDAGELTAVVRNAVQIRPGCVGVLRKKVPHDVADAKCTRMSGKRNTTVLGE